LEQAVQIKPATVRWQSLARPLIVVSVPESAVSTSGTENCLSGPQKNNTLLMGEIADASHARVRVPLRQRNETGLHIPDFLFGGIGQYWPCKRCVKISINSN
jgi:hypothetical protein